MSKTGRNDACPCGSGKKYKKCCLSVDNAARAENVNQEQELVADHVHGPDCDHEEPAPPVRAPHPRHTQGRPQDHDDGHQPLVRQQGR